MDNPPSEMDSTTFLHLTTLLYLLLQSLPLLLWPSLTTTLLTPPNYYPPSSSDLVSTYLARTLALTNLTLAALLLALSGLLPLSPSPSPYSSAAVLITTLYHSATGVYSYTRYTTPRTSQPIHLLGCLASSFLACVGLYVLLFGDGKRLSRRTGADKATSGWPFRNKEADRKKKKKKSG
ncbi:hypothetical protein QC763_109035 [Podospora pseudopauciseta]|uniref:Uncharacterized protein n=1 Tax=Podospora pseudopauciseta TaxID=2093780 RepID=A0ABR0HYT2_9PEZI|nr:hypothetical protein QC763_109035 [Podospora pseudopauciseta]